MSNNNEKEIFLVPYAHLDTQWRWEYPTTIRKYIKKTLDENFDLFEKYPEYQFNFTGAIRYAMMKEYYPERFEKLKNYVKEGRWNITGTCLDETDALIPCVESMIRNILYGDRWAKKEFGTSSKDYMIPDCFGFPENMPSILAHCGIIGFSSQKLTWNSAVGIPFELGIWKGPDGGEVISAFNPCSYNSRLFPPLHMNKRRLNRLENLGKKNDIWKSFQYYGVGDIGGAPSEGSVKRAIKAINHVGEKIEGLKVKQGSTDEFFENLSNEEINKMDNYQGDLLLINHSAGTLTSAAIMKRWNRKNEIMAFSAEVAAVTAMLYSELPYPSEKVRSAWYRVIGNQMHDILPGTSTPIAYQYSQNDEVVALNTWSSILEDSATAIAPLVKGDGDLLLFNPLWESRKDAVDIMLHGWDINEFPQAEVIDAGGNSLPAQLKKMENGNIKLIFIPELSPFSWSKFNIIKKEITSKKENLGSTFIKENDNSYILENSNYRVEITKDGTVPSIFHKGLKKEIITTPLAYEFQKEKPSLFPAWNMDWKDRKEPPFLRIEGGQIVSVIEDGPLRCTVQIISAYNESVFIREISLNHDSEIVEFCERINWREKQCSLKIAFNFPISSSDVTYNWETSRIKRGINHEKLFEMPSRYWVDIGDGKWGISIIEDCKYGYDHPDENTVRMTLLYTPHAKIRTGYLDQKYHDWGQHTIRYGLYVHEDDFKSTDTIAKRFNHKVHAFNIKNKQESSIEGIEIPPIFDISTNQLGVLSVKKPEENINLDKGKNNGEGEGEAVLIRIYERFGKNVDTEISLNQEILSVKGVNGIEEILQDVAFTGKSFKIHLNANAIGSYIVNFKSSKPKKHLSIKHESLNIPFNSKIIGTESDKDALIPSKLIPLSISAGNIAFNLSKEDNLNSLQCNGQEIPIPEEFNTISLLAGSNCISYGQFKWIDADGKIIKETTHHIGKFTGFIGQWDTRIWKRTPKRHLKDKRDYIWLNKCVGVESGYIKRDRVEWYSTHTYENSVVKPYHYGYLYNIDLDIPDGAKTLIIPDDPSIYIMAITTSQQFNRVSSNNVLNDKYDYY